MSDVVLASKYAAENYPLALKNLAKRYQKNDDGEAVHFSELGFGDISDQQAKVALRYFADTGLIENTKHANYIPPESVVSWQRKMGDRAEEAKEEARQSLLDYDVFNETVFVLEEGEQALNSLAEQVGGMVGIDEDELSEMKRTIEVFSKLGFVHIDEDGVVSLPDSSGGGVIDTEELEEETSADAGGGPASAEDHDSSDASTSVKGTDPNSEVTQSISDGPSGDMGASKSQSDVLNAELNITIDATDMDANELESKLGIIEETFGHDGE